MRALGETRTTGRGWCAVSVAAKRSAQRRQAAIRVSNPSFWQSMIIRYRSLPTWQSIHAG
jgi:hypothetical protein